MHNSDPVVKIVERIAVGTVLCSDSVDELTKNDKIDVEFLDETEFIEHSPHETTFLVVFWDIDSIEGPVFKDVSIKAMADENLWRKLCGF